MRRSRSWNVARLPSLRLSLRTSRVYHSDLGTRVTEAFPGDTMSRPHAVRMQRSTPAQTNAHNLTIAKRATLHQLTTIAVLLRHVDERVSRNALACIRPIDLALQDTRTLFGHWNSGFPSTVTLLNAAKRLLALKDQESSDALTALMLETMAALCRYIARAMYPDVAARGVAEQHTDLLSKARAVVDDDAWFVPFADNRTHTFERLLAQLR